MELGSVAASLAVLAGIAASDAACCRSLGERSRSENHRDAEALMAEIIPNGKRAAKQLRALLNLKDAAAPLDDRVLVAQRAAKSIRTSRPASGSSLRR